MKKSFIIILLFTLTLLSNNKVFCEDGTLYTENYFQYIINEDNDITIVKYYGKESDVTVPRTIGTHIVTIIADDTFEDTNVISLRVPDTIVSIYDTSINDMRIIYYDVFGEDIKEKKGEDIIIPEPKESETKGNSEGTIIQIEPKESKTVKSNSETMDEISVEEDEKEESFKIINTKEDTTLKEIQETNDTISSNSTVIIVSYIFVLIVIAIIVLLIIKKKINNK